MLINYCTENGVSDVTGIDDFDDGMGTMTLTDAYPSNKATAGSSARSQLTENFSPSTSPVPAGFISNMPNKPSPAAAFSRANTADNEATSGVPKTARCKRCGIMISRSMEAIEAHMEECGSINSPHGRNASVAVPSEKSYTLNGPDGPITISSGLSKSFGGITRRPELENFGTRIIYRTARKQSGKFIRPREVCALQDSFIDEEGVCYVYEISVRHCDVMGLPEYVTADVMVGFCASAVCISCFFFVLSDLLPGMNMTVLLPNSSFESALIVAFYRAFCIFDDMFLFAPLTLILCVVHSLQLLMHVAQPVKGCKGMSNISIISQVGCPLSHTLCTVNAGT